MSAPTLYERFTATDEIEPWERRGIADNVRWEARRLCSIAFHEAAAAQERAFLARVTDKEAKAATLNAQHEAAAMRLVDLLDAYIAMPAVKIGDAKGKADDIKTFRPALVGAHKTWATWLDRHERWQEVIASELASLRETRARKGAVA